MNMNQQAYAEAYQRTVEGKPSRTSWGRMLSLFEDEYTRQARLKGERDGIAAREAASEGSRAELPVAEPAP